VYDAIKLTQQCLGTGATISLADVMIVAPAEKKSKAIEPTCSVAWSAGKMKVKAWTCDTRPTACKNYDSLTAVIYSLGADS